MKLPVTRYYGSKRRVVDKIWHALRNAHIKFNSFLDLFGGTGIVSYYMLAKGKQVCYNDLFAFNCENAKALLASPKNTLSESEALELLKRVPGVDYDNVIERNYHGIYYLDQENRLIDTIVQNIARLPKEKQASAYYLLNQTCLIKRPFNLFHRRNLNLRLNHQTSSFGNYVTWGKSFEELFRQFVNELNSFQFEKPQNVRICNNDALDCDREYDVVYIDPPYFSESTPISYHSRYHFLEGLIYYDDIETHINHNKVNLEIDINSHSEFDRKDIFKQNLRDLFKRYQKSILVLSYTTNGYPSIEELKEVMKDFKRNVKIISLGEKPFALNHKNKGREEVLIIGQ
jgi:hypothetical protein